METIIYTILIIMLLWRHRKHPVIVIASGPRISTPRNPDGTKMIRKSANETYQDRKQYKDEYDVLNNEYLELNKIIGTFFDENPEKKEIKMSLNQQKSLSLYMKFLIANNHTNDIVPNTLYSWWLHTTVFLIDKIGTLADPDYVLYKDKVDTLKKAISDFEDNLYFIPEIRQKKIDILLG